MKQPHRSRWRLTLVAALATLGIVVVGAIASWRYIDDVTPFHPQLPPMPEPNGYVVAAQATSQLSKIHRPPPPSRWPAGTREELLAQLQPIKPVLKAVRGSFELQWRSPQATLKGLDPVLSGS